jgi:integrase
MSPRAKPPRLWFRPAQRDRSGRITHVAAYFILDRERYRRRQIPTGTDSKAEAERIFSDYLNEKHQEQISSSGIKDPSRIPVADVVALYAKDVVPRHSQPIASKQRLSRILDFFGNHMLSEVSGQLCRKYAAQCNTDTMARRDLEELRAAINHHRKEGLTDRIISVWLPERRQPRERWLTRDEAAKLLRACWRRGKSKHIAKYILLGLYTGRRASVICSASFYREAGRAFVDVNRGMLLPPERVKITKKRNPPIPLPPRLLVHLRAWKKNGQRYVVEWGGRAITRSQTLKDIAMEIGLGKDITNHTLRHTAATWQMQAGTNIFEAGQFLGMTTRTLESIYAHAHPDYLSEAKRAATRIRQHIVNRSPEPKVNKKAHLQRKNADVMGV